jgi:flagellin
MSITRVNTNFDAIFSANMLKQTELQLQRAMMRISSGKRINYAADDPTGVGQLTQAKASLGGSRQAQRNIQEDLAMLQFVDGVMQTFEDKVIELRDMAVRGANDATLSTDQQTSLATQFTNSLLDLASAKMDEVRWNDKQVMSALAAQNFHVSGISGTTGGFTIAANAMRMNSTNQGTAGTSFAAATVATAAGAQAALTTLSTALTAIGTARAGVGTAMSRLEYALEEQMNMEVNYASAVSTIGDANMADEISKLTTAQIIAQSGAAMLGQANIHSQTLLNILM